MKDSNHLILCLSWVSVTSGLAPFIEYAQSAYSRIFLSGTCTLPRQFIYLTAMHTFNHTLEKSFLAADGRYLTIQEMSSMEQFLQSYASRLEVYQSIRDHSNALVEQALKKLGQEYPDIIRKHGQRCQYDMQEVLRYIALSILRDDEIFFKEQMMSWLDTILLAHKRHAHCAVAYRYLQEATNAVLTPNGSSLVRPYFENVIMTLQAHA